MKFTRSTALVSSLCMLTAGAALLAQAQDRGYDLEPTVGETVQNSATAKPHIIYRHPVYGDRRSDKSVFILQLGSSEEISVKDITIDTSRHFAVLKIPTIHRDSSGNLKTIEIPYAFESGAKNAMKEIQEKGFSIDVSRCVVTTDERIVSRPLQDEHGKIVIDRASQLPKLCRYRDYKRKINCSAVDTTPTVSNYVESHFAELVGGNEIELKIIEDEFMGCDEGRKSPL